MKLDETITFRSGHTFKPNGVGDYELHCPVHGLYPNSIMFMVARLAQAGTTCPMCKQQFGARFQTAEVVEGATATEDVKGRRKTTVVVTDNAGVKDR